MAFAVISDVHGNITALEAVLDDIASQQIDGIYFLGDAVNYGPDWGECTARLASVIEFGIRGNHDAAVLNGPPNNFNPMAKALALWTKSQIEAQPDGSAQAFLQSLVASHEIRPHLFVHGSPRGPESEYIFARPGRYSQHISDDMLKDNFKLVDRVAFMGHTHMPLVWQQDATKMTCDVSGDPLKVEPGKKYMVNVGSVGQPRDNNPSSCYVLVDGDQITFRRVSYDVDAQIQRLEDSGIDSWLKTEMPQGLQCLDAWAATVGYTGNQPAASYLGTRLSKGC